MPVHRVLIADVEIRLNEIEATERVVSVTGAGDGAVLVFTEARDSRRLKPGQPENRAL